MMSELSLTVGFKTYDSWRKLKRIIVTPITFFYVDVKHTIERQDTKTI